MNMKFTSEIQDHDVCLKNLGQMIYIDSRSLEGGNGGDHRKLGKKTGF
jgi:Fe-S cluster assembly iron-binding protein IscA